MTYQWRAMARITAEDAENEIDPIFPVERKIEHYEKLIAGDGITCSDLIVFGAELRKALRAKREAERAHNHAPTGS